MIPTRALEAERRVNRGERVVCRPKRSIVHCLRVAVVTTVEDPGLVVGEVQRVETKGESMPLAADALLTVPSQSPWWLRVSSGFLRMARLESARGTTGACPVISPFPERLGLDRC